MSSCQVFLMPLSLPSHHQRLPMSWSGSNGGKSSRRLCWAWLLEVGRFGCSKTPMADWFRTQAQQWVRATLRRRMEIGRHCFPCCWKQVCMRQTSSLRRVRRQSRIDYVCAPQALSSAVSRAGTCEEVLLQTGAGWITYLSSLMFRYSPCKE